MRDREKAIDTIAPIIEKMESRAPERAIARAVIAAYEALPDSAIEIPDEMLKEAINVFTRDGFIDDQDEIWTLMYHIKEQYERTTD